MRPRMRAARPSARSRASAAAKAVSRPRLALGLSGGGDSTALLFALRAALPECELHALIVDHGLRPESGGEAQSAAATALAAGATPHILRWTAPRSGQGHARAARHSLLAGAAHEIGARIVCLGHTLDDRIETLRMRAARPGDEARMAGPAPFDPSPIWPEGEGLILARPFLGLRRDELRRYLKALGAGWIDDPSNEDLRYERARVRATPISTHEELELLARSDSAQHVRADLHGRAKALLEAACRLTAWGGARLDPDTFAVADPAVASKALETLVLAVSGAAAPPAPAQIQAVLAGLLTRRAASAGGAYLTARGVLGRDGGGAGRADGTRGADALVLSPGESGVFDGRWRVRTERPVIIRVLGGQQAAPAGDAPPALRSALAVIHDPAREARLGVAGRDAVEGVEMENLASARIDARLLPTEPPTWFDGVKIAAQVRAALAKPVLRPNMKRDDAGPALVQAAQDFKPRRGK